ncbi:hypothetical protein CI109_104942 [Kwoniella shandongensis]|uniref:Uncharacterized protein n=1 Tax=Kwoniella shandongensis TaxID=1734106 RepID=A0A5M6BR38_9TREE|nr:uncharacterized protein CI109_006263 [Kwoniella shandongensis]KAA5525364.1 hypothetical protein CI109_006263 [Kwoniella shandongensis]
MSAISIKSAVTPHISIAQVLSQSIVNEIIHDSQTTKLSRSLSVSSSNSTTSTSSTYSRSAEDMVCRLAGQEPHVLIDLWSGGNVRIDGRDLTLTPHDAEDLLHAIKADERFEFVKVTSFDTEGEDWKISFRRSDIVDAGAIAEAE